MTLSEELAWRGFVNQTTFDDIAALDGEPRKFYFGVDPSGHGMQIGNLAAAMMIRHMIAHGHHAYLLVGGATGMIGDPDGKLDERDLKAVEEIAHNKEEITRQYQQVFAGQQFQVVDNYDWFKSINYLEFLRDIGKHVPMSMMLGREFIQTRLGDGGNGISYAEFSYALIQGYDFLHLYREHGVTLQVCGADQWGNSIAGVDLIRRIESAEAHVYSVPLVINRATGRKFGKSEGGTIWLDAGLTSVYQFYQFWLNVDDEGVIDYMKIYTLLSKDEIEAIAAEQRSAPETRVAQKRLAWEVTALIHGEERARAAKQATAILFGSEVYDGSDESVVAMLSEELPTARNGMAVTDILHDTGITQSKGEGRRLIAGGAISLNGQKISEDQIVASPNLLKKGKNTFVLVM